MILAILAGVFSTNVITCIVGLVIIIAATLIYTSAVPIKAEPRRRDPR